MKRKNLARLFIIIIPYIAIGAMIYVFNERFMVANHDGEIIFGMEYTKELLENDESHVFYRKNGTELVSVKSTKEVTKKVLETKSFTITSAADSTLSFVVSLKDSINKQPYAYTNVSKVLALSDIEGDFEKLYAILKNNKIIDDKCHWAFNNGHLILNGDFFDRGTDVTACLWLIYKLEDEAQKAGGGVHFILGNHEEMNLRGNVKYVELKYQQLAKELAIPYKELYGLDTELGRWLRTKNSVEIINNYMFCHAGIKTDLVNNKMEISTINELVQKYLGEDKRTVCFRDENACLLFGEKGLMWYRGYFQDHKNDYKQATEAEVEAVCKFYGVEKIIVGHTIVDEIKTHYKGRVIGIDVLRYEPIGKNKPSALLIENNQFFAVDELGRKFPVK